MAAPSISPPPIPLGNPHARGDAKRHVPLAQEQTARPIAGDLAGGGAPRATGDPVRPARHWTACPGRSRCRRSGSRAREERGGSRREAGATCSCGAAGRNPIRVRRTRQWQLRRADSGLPGGTDRAGPGRAEPGGHGGRPGECEAAVTALTSERPADADPLATRRTAQTPGAWADHTGPAVVLGLGAVHYRPTHVLNSDLSGHTEQWLRGALNEFAERTGEHVTVRPYFAGISDMSFLGRVPDATDQFVRRQTPFPAHLESPGVPWAFPPSISDRGAATTISVWNAFIGPTRSVRCPPCCGTCFTPA